MIDEQELDRLERFAAAKDLHWFEQTLKEIEKKWNPLRPEDYFALVLRIFNVLSSTDFDDNQQRAVLIQGLATRALEKQHVIPLEIELELLLQLEMVPEQLKVEAQGEAWSTRRSDAVKLWFRAWQRLEQSIDRDFDFSDVPEKNVAPPPGSGVIPGMSSEYIVSPRVRKAYEEAIKRNRQKGENYSEQRKLRDLEEMFSSRAEQFIIGAYSKPPFDLDELNHYLESYIADRDTRERILEAVKQQMPKSSR
jgi:hypothetical protein